MHIGGVTFEVAVKLAVTDKSEESWNFFESASWSNHEKEVTIRKLAAQDGVFHRTTNLRPKSNNDLDANNGMWFIHECHTPSCSSSWSGPCG